MLRKRAFREYEKNQEKEKKEEETKKRERKKNCYLDLSTRPWGEPRIGNFEWKRRRRRRRRKWRRETNKKLLEQGTYIWWTRESFRGNIEIYDYYLFFSCVPPCLSLRLLLADSRTYFKRRSEIRIYGAKGSNKVKTWNLGIPPFYGIVIISFFTLLLFHFFCFLSLSTYIFTISLFCVNNGAA